MAPGVAHTGHFLVSNEADATPAPMQGPGVRIPRERIDKAAELYLKGLQRSSITSELCKLFKVSARQARKYVALALRRFAHAEPVSPEAARARSEEMLLEAAELARAKKDAKALATCAARLAELAGATGPKKLEVSGPGGGPVRMTHYTPEQAAAELAALLAKATGAAPPDAGSGADAGSAGEADG